MGGHAGQTGDRDGHDTAPVQHLLCGKVIPSVCGDIEAEFVAVLPVHTGHARVAAGSAQTARGAGSRGARCPRCRSEPAPPRRRSGPSGASAVPEQGKRAARSFFDSAYIALTFII